MASPSSSLYGGPYTHITLTPPSDSDGVVRMAALRDGHLGAAATRFSSSCVVLVVC